MASSNNFGHIDRAAEKDSFNIEKYVKGLADFIENCNTPMTLAIQGDWGTGKTSIMNMLRKRIKDNPNISEVWFNTWQFSQFKLDDQLPLMLMSKLVSSVSDDKNSTVKDTLSTIGKLAGKFAGNIILGNLSNGAADISTLQSDTSLTEYVDTIDRLRDDFQKLVDAKAGVNGRVVVFVDDLDRLQPGKAVELLEVLKIFLDCEKCVFVLAIDYSVVIRGVKEKYGEDFSADKGKSFFDKIIQVPFKVPIGDYNIKNYLKEGLEPMGMQVDDESLKLFEGLINDSIGNNPRSIKRLLNSYLLLSKIADDDLLEDEQTRAILFALLCMQSQFEDIYNYLISHRNTLTAENIYDLKDESSELYKELELSPEAVKPFIKFVQDFIYVIDVDDSESIEPAELKKLKDALSFSAITSTSGQEQETDQFDYRWAHRDRMRFYLEPLREAYPNMAIRDKYTRGRDLGTWKLQTDKAAKTPDGREFRFFLNVGPFESDEGMKSSISVCVSAAGGKSKNPIAGLLSEIGRDPLGLSDAESEVVDAWNELWYSDVLVFDTKSAFSADDEVFRFITSALDSIKQYWE